MDLSKDEELKDVEQKPLTNEDKLDLLLAQMMETSVKSSEKVTQVHKQTQNVDENISQEIAEIIPVKYVTPAPDITPDIEKNIEIEKEFQQTKKRKPAGGYICTYRKGNIKEGFRRKQSRE